MEEIQASFRDTPTSSSTSTRTHHTHTVSSFPLHTKAGDGRKEGGQDRLINHLVEEDRWIEEAKGDSVLMTKGKIDCRTSMQDCPSSLLSFSAPGSNFRTRLTWKVSPKLLIHVNLAAVMQGATQKGLSNTYHKERMTTCDWLPGTWRHRCNNDVSAEKGNLRGMVQWHYRKYTC